MKKNLCAPDRARPELANQILRVILPEGLHKKNGSWALSRAQVAREASEGVPFAAEQGYLGSASAASNVVMGQLCPRRIQGGPNSSQIIILSN